MTTSELIKRLNSLDFVGSVEYDEDAVYAYSEKDRMLGGVECKTVEHADMSYAGFHTLRDCERRQLFILCSEYALTPLDQREEAKKYELRLKLNKNEILNKNSIGLFFVNNKIVTPRLQTEFTQAEIDEIKAKYGENCLDSFEQVEVES